MNLHNFKDQDAKGKALLILTYPSPLVCIGWNGAG